MVNLRTKDLIFVSYQDKYAKECHENFLSQAETAKYMLWKTTNNEEEARAKLTAWSSNLRENDVFCLIQEAKSKRIVGFVSFWEIDAGVYGDIGIAIGLDFLKKGYGSQTLSLLIETIKQRKGKEIHYSHFLENEASRALALKFGFEFYKKEKRTRKHDNKTFDELFYCLNLI